MRGFALDTTGVVTIGGLVSHFFKTSYYLFFVQRLGFAALSVDTNLAPTFQRYGKQVSLPTA